MKIVCVGRRKTLLVVFVSIVLFAAVFCLNAFSPAVLAAAAKKRALPVYSVERSDKKISISFDCAWGVDYTDELLKIMDEYDVKCTFFMVQFWAEKYPEYVKKIAGAGHEIGTHSKTHPKMSELAKAEIEEELSSSCSAIEKITGKRPELFRPPFGDYDNLLIETAKEQGLFTIQWDVDSLDWKNLSAQNIALRVINGVKSGSIILCHNNGLHTAQALPMILSSLKNKGYSFVPIGELIYRENYTIGSDGRQISAG